MDININFFENELNKAIGSGIYKVSVQREDEKKANLYIGQSTYMVVRCAEHLYEFGKIPEYFGFSDSMISNRKLTLIFEVIELESDNKKRGEKEKSYIKKFKPLTQSGSSDRMKKIVDKKKALEQFICGS